MRYLQLEADRLKLAYQRFKLDYYATYKHLAAELGVKWLDACRILNAWENKTSYEEQGLQLIVYEDKNIKVGKLNWRK